MHLARARKSASVPLFLLMRPLRLCLLCAAMLTTVSVTRATTVIPPEFPELVASSDYIIRGKVVSLTNEIRQREGREVPFTLAEIAVSEVIAGTPPAKVVLTMLGGSTSDGRELHVEGVPRLTVGDEHILFVQGNGTNFYPLKGVMHGLYPVKFDKKLGREYVARANGVPLSSTAEVALPLAEGKIALLLSRLRTAEDALTPNEFVQSIRETRIAKNNGGVSRAK